MKKMFLGLLMVCVVGIGCQRDDKADCEITNVDCYCGGAPGSTSERCADLKTISICKPGPPCMSGPPCEYNTETCPDVCMETERWAECGLDGFRFDGAGGMAVGYTQGAQSERPAVLVTTDYGVTWQFQELDELPNGCTHLRFEQILFVDPSTGWIRSSGEGTDCPPGLFHTADGGVSWRFDRFPENPNGGWIGGDHLHVSDVASDRLFSAGSPPAVSSDGGQTWQALTQPEDDWPTGTLTAVPIGGFAVLSNGEELCVSSDPITPHGAVYCGPSDGSHWRVAYRSEAPVLAMSDDGSGNTAWAVVAELPVLAIRMDRDAPRWEDFEIDQYQQANRATIQFLNPTSGFLTLFNEVRAIVYLWSDSSGPSFTWVQMRGEIEEPGYNVSVQTESRLWAVGSNGDGLSNIAYTPSPSVGFQFVSVSVPKPIHWTGIAVGITAPETLPTPQ